MRTYVKEKTILIEFSLTRDLRRLRNIWEGIPWRHYYVSQALNFMKFKAMQNESVQLSIHLNNEE